jgi:hypothetical protein
MKIAKIAKIAKNHAWGGVNGMGIEATCTVKIKHGAAEQRSSVRREPSLATSSSMIWYGLATRRPFRPALGGVEIRETQVSLDCG